MYLLAYNEVEKNGRKFRIATLYDPNSKRQKVFEKFLNEGVTVPQNKLILPEDLEELEQVDVVADLSGNVVSIN